MTIMRFNFFNRLTALGKIYHFLSTRLGRAVLCCLEFYIINKKKNNATLMAQEGVIVQITFSF